MNTILTTMNRTEGIEQTKHKVDSSDLYDLLSTLLAEETEPTLCRELAERGINRLSVMPINAFENIGISTEKSLVLRAYFDRLHKGCSSTQQPNKDLFKIRFPRDAAALAKHGKKVLDDEIILLLLNDLNEVIGKDVIVANAKESYSIEPNVLFRKAVNASASSILLTRMQSVHDHSYCLSDRENCNAIKDAGQLIGIPLNDYIIVENDQFASFKEKGLL